MTQTPYISTSARIKNEMFQKFLEDAQIVPSPIGVLRIRDYFSTPNGLRHFHVAILEEDGGVKLSDGKTYFTASESYFSWRSVGLELENVKGRSFPVKARKNAKSFEASLETWSELAGEVEQAVFDTYISGAFTVVQPYNVQYETKVHDLVLKTLQSIRDLKAEIENTLSPLRDEAGLLTAEHEQMYSDAMIKTVGGGYYGISPHRPISSNWGERIRLAF
jgi:hypothetical protein